MNNQINLIESEIDFLNLILKNPQIPSVVVITIHGHIKKLEQSLIKLKEVKQNGSTKIVKG